MRPEQLPAINRPEPSTHKGFRRHTDINLSPLYTGRIIYFTLRETSKRIHQRWHTALRLDLLVKNSLDQEITRMHLLMTKFRYANYKVTWTERFKNGLFTTRLDIRASVMFDEMAVTYQNYFLKSLNQKKKNYIIKQKNPK